MAGFKKEVKKNLNPKPSILLSPEPGLELGLAA